MTGDNLQTSPYEVNRESCLGGTFSTVLLMRIFPKAKNNPLHLTTSFHLPRFEGVPSKVLRVGSNRTLPKNLSLNGFDLFQKPAPKVVSNGVLNYRGNVP